MDLVKGTKLADYELVMRIGRGGMATVWIALEHARNARNDRLVAVKAMLADLADEPEFIRMFLDEVRLIRAIRHPNVVDVYDVGEEDGVMWMAMEWVEGESLHSVIAEAGKRRAIPSEIAVRIIADAAAGLHAAHELKDVNGVPQNLVHRDVSPHNILIGTSGAVKLVDFGVAKAVGRMSDQTRSGHLKGKFGYMSPEQASGQDVDRRSDVFALGIVLYELTTSRRLFRGASDLETLRLVTGGQIPRPTTLDRSYPPGLERVVLKALDRDRERRYQTAQQLEADLRAFLKSERIVVPQSGVAGLLKRVMGARIEQRRKAVRKALGTLAAPESTKAPELISWEPAFTPTGGGLADAPDDSQISAVSSLSQLSSLSQVAPPPQRSQPELSHASKLWQRIVVAVLLMLAGVFGYLLYDTRLKHTLFSRQPSSNQTPVTRGLSNGPSDEGPPGNHSAAGTIASVPASGSSPGPDVPRLSLDELELERDAGRDAEPEP